MEVLPVVYAVLTVDAVLAWACVWFDPRFDSISGMSRLSAQREALLALIRSFGSCAVAYSGGVDSAVVAQAARLALADRAVAITGVSASLASGELEAAQQLARQIGIRHEVLSTHEFEQDAYTRNHGDRCYHCKTELYAQMAQAAQRLQLAVLVNGANQDDVGDYRPGMQAAQQHHVRSPLLECGLTKADVRGLAAHWQLAVWDKPASPCLSSRVQYGVAVNPQRLAMVDRAEHYLRELGLREVRVRIHDGDLARIEIPLADLPRLANPSVREGLVAHLRALGCQFVTLDLEGFRSGSLNRMLSAPPQLHEISLSTRDA